MKDTLVASRFVHRNPLDLPRISYHDIIQNIADGVHVEEPEQARRFLRMPPAFHDDPDRAQLFPTFSELTVAYPPVFTISLRHVTLVGFRTVLSPDGFFVNDVGYLDTRTGTVRGDYPTGPDGRGRGIPSRRLRTARGAFGRTCRSANIG
jgi:hypothetical protein